MQPKKEIKIPYSFCKGYCNYLRKREIFFLAFCANKSYLPFFITVSIFFFCLSLMFTIHSFFFTTYYIDLRYSQPEELTPMYWIENEMLKCLYVAVINNLVKIIIIKLLIFFVFRIEKKLITKKNYFLIMNRLRCRSTAVFSILILIMCVVFYINTCYCGIYLNTQGGLFLGFGVSVVFSFCISLIICFLINIVRAIGICCNTS